MQIALSHARDHVRPRKRAERRGFALAKRAFDIAGALVLLPLCLIVALALVVLNPIMSPGPLLFRQRRLGEGGRPFDMIKFRTMHGAPAGPRFADREAHRITPLGRFLRTYRLDELPQLLHVLRGEMSLVGPRPEQEAFARDFLTRLPHYRKRLAVRPGISGLAQVRLGYAGGVEGTRRKLRYDLLYVRRAGFRMEFFTIVQTLVVLATGRGAR